ncbi:MAG: HAD-IIA family hydrolase [Micromonosporaceae bacterium]
MGEVALADQYDLLIFDLDGVLYVGEDAVPQAAETVTRLRGRDARLCYVTNNASRSAAKVAELLTRLGVPAEQHQVLTSAQAAAELLAESHPAGAPVLVIGAPALADEVAAVRLTPVHRADDKPVAVVQGYGPDVGWRQLAEAAVALADGATWVATNVDLTVPSPRGPLPGNGALVAALVAAIGRQPDIVVGKPSPGLFAGAVRRFPAARPLVVGDRLDTDIAGAVRAGHHSVLVFTGVSTPAEVLAAGPAERPTYLARDLTDLLRPYPDVSTRGGGTRCRGWTVSATDGGHQLDGVGEPLDALRALCAAAWADPGSAPDGEPVIAATAEAAQALSEWGLTYRRKS